MGAVEITIDDDDDDDDDEFRSAFRLYNEKLSTLIPEVHACVMRFGVAEVSETEILRASR